MKRSLFITAAVPLLLLVGGGGAIASAAPAAPTLAPMTDPDPSDDPEERIRQFVQCMRDNGIDLPDPTGADGPVKFEIGPEQKEEFEGALKACEAYAPAHGKRVELDPATREKIEEFDGCLREHGVDVPKIGVSVVGPVLREAGESVKGEGPVLTERPGGPGVPPPPRGDGPGDVHVGSPVPVPDEALEACKDLLPVPPAGGSVVVGGDVVVGEAGGDAAGGGISISVVKATAGGQ
jgi:hypothetical protein